MLSQAQIDQITQLVGNSALAHRAWSGRGAAPLGYIKGVAVTFGLVYSKLKAGDSATLVMAAANSGDDNVDALSWYNSNFNNAGMKNDVAGVDVLRHLFVLLYGLGMRESSGNCFEGMDASASNTSGETAEAGLFQQSRNSFSASPELGKLIKSYQDNPSWGFLSIFREGLSGSPSQDHGSGDGVVFQHLCKTSPAFAVEAAAVGLRTIRKHWGPINRKEAEIRPEADALLQQVQKIVDSEAIAVRPSTPTTPNSPVKTSWLDNLWKSFGALISSKIDGAVGTAPLKRGDKGPQVELVQHALINVGALLTGGADGDFGPKTEIAVKGYQMARGLPITGIVDSVTGAALAQAPVKPQETSTATPSAWPHEAQSGALDAFYGDPRGSGSNASTSWANANLTKIVPPFKMTYEGAPVAAITIHKKCAESLLRVLNKIWEYYGKDQAKINAVHLNEFDGSFNYRTNRNNSSKLSLHAYAAALDIAANENANGREWKPGMMPIAVVKIFAAEGWTWGGQFGGTKDCMHFQATFNSHADQSLPQE